MENKNTRTIVKEMENRRPNNKDSIAFRLNYAINRMRYTAKDVARLTEDKKNGIKGIHPATLSLYINGKSVPNRSYTERLAKVLRVDPSWLSCFLPFEYIDNPKSSKKDGKELMDIYEKLNDEYKQLLINTAKIYAKAQSLDNIDAETN